MRDAGGVVYDFGRIPHEVAQTARDWAASNVEQDASAYAQQQQPYAPQPAQAAPAEPDYTAELERLAKLRDEGVITPEDFDAKKRQLLDI